MTLAPVVVAIDQGTTSVRATVVAARHTDAGDVLEVLGSRSVSIERGFPRPGWVELDAEAVVLATRQVLSEAVAVAGRTASDIAAVGLANQGETVVVWDRTTGRPLGPAIVWQCRRTEAACAALRSDEAALRWVQDKTGLPIDAYFSATKLAWILDEATGGRARAERGELCAGTLDSYTVWRLTHGSRFVTDPSTACRTLLADLATGRFDDELCRYFRVPSQILAEVVPSDHRIDGFEALDGATTMRAMLCDQPSALLGSGCIDPGDNKCTYGTGAFVQVNTGAAPRARPDAGDDGLLRSIAWELEGRRTYLLEGSVMSAGDVLTWLRDGLGMIAGPEEVDEVLRTVPDAGGVLFLPALTGIGAPRWVGDARGMIVGLHRGARREHLIRAALEGIAHQVADVLDAAGAIEPMWADGGVASSAAFLQLQADLSGRSLQRADSWEATTRGVAAVAAAGAGLISSIEVAARREPALRIEPSLPPEARAAHRDTYRRLLDLCSSPAALGLTLPSP
jgi:glycerol kinase